MTRGTLPRPRLTTLYVDEGGASPITTRVQEDMVARWLTSSITFHTKDANASGTVAFGLGAAPRGLDSIAAGTVLGNVLHAYKWVTLAGQTGWQAYQNNTDLGCFVIEAGEVLAVTWDRTLVMSFHGFFTLAWTPLVEWRRWVQ